jgi:anti-sigma factor RsiW
VQCPEALRVQAYFDAELDPMIALEVERHLQHCADCRALLGELGQLRIAMRHEAPYAQAPPALRARIARTLDGEDAGGPRSRSLDTRLTGLRAFWIGATSGLVTAAVAAGIALLLFASPRTSPLIDALVNAHVSSLLSTHLIDVQSTDQHTVKPWFAGHTEVSPVVADFDAQGYKLVGGRVDYLEHQRAAVVVYRHGLHVINVFTWAAAGRALPRQLTRDGYHLASWRMGDLEYCAISDTAWDELQGLVRLLQQLGARDNSP